MNKFVERVVLGAIAVLLTFGILFAWLVWPTPYTRHERVDGYDYRWSRFTDQPQVFFRGDWRTMKVWREMTKAEEKVAEDLAAQARIKAKAIEQENERARQAEWTAYFEKSRAASQVALEQARATSQAAEASRQQARLRVVNFLNSVQDQSLPENLRREVRLYGKKMTNFYFLTESFRTDQAGMHTVGQIHTEIEYARAHYGACREPHWDQFLTDAKASAKK